MRGGGSLRLLERFFYACHDGFMVAVQNERVEAERARQAKAAGLAAAAATPVTVAKSPAEEAHTAPGGKKKSKRKKKRAKKKVDMETTGSGAAEAAETAEAEEAAETSPTARHGGVSAEEAWFDDTGETCGTPTLETEEDGTKTPREKRLVCGDRRTWRFNRCSVIVTTVVGRSLGLWSHGGTPGSWRRKIWNDNVLSLARHGAWVMENFVEHFHRTSLFLFSLFSIHAYCLQLGTRQGV